MSGPIFLFSAVQFLLSSLLAFSISALFVKISFTLFQIKNKRLKASLRLIPFLMVCLEAFLSKLRIGQWFNPLSCESCLQKGFLLLLPKEVQAEIAEKHMSFAEWFTGYVPEIWLKIPFLLIATITCGQLAYRLFHHFQSRRFFKQLIQQSTECKRTVKNPLLSHALQGCPIYSSYEIEVPIAVQGPLIIMPKSLENSFSQAEFDAVIAHEWEHLRWKDPMSQVACEWLSSLFWWIPFKTWAEKREEEQEEAADEGIANYKIDPTDLASALMRVVKKESWQEFDTTSICQLAHKTKPVLQRMRLIFQMPQAEYSIFYCLGGMALGSLITVSCMIF